MIDPCILREILDFEPDTGRLFWRPRGIEFFSDVQNPRACQKHFNTRYAGRQALNCSHVTGYLHGLIFQKAYKAHRVVWAHQTGSWPDADIDHINGDRSDNRLINLRDVPRSVNCKNQKRHRTNTSGASGVSFDRASNRWRARITVDGQLRYLGRFKSFSEAASARKSAEIASGFHENHGRA